MKRTIFGFPAFVVAFFLGYIIVLTFQANPFQNILGAQNTDPSPAFAIRSGNVEFAAEFIGLPNFDNATTSNEFPVKLMDFYEHGRMFRHNDIIASPGETWMGLFENYGMAYLGPITIKPEFLPASAGYPNGFDVRLGIEGRTDNPVFVVRGANSLKEGTVVSLYHRPPPDEMFQRHLPIKSMSMGYNEKFHLGYSVYTLRVAPGITRDGTRANVLVLEHENITQALVYNRYYNNHSNIGDLLWVGDLDGDGKLDIYFDDFDFGIGDFGSNLFLSSEAGPGDLVKQVAFFGTKGCKLQQC